MELAGARVRAFPGGIAKPFMRWTWEDKRALDSKLAKVFSKDHLAPHLKTTVTNGLGLWKDPALFEPSARSFPNQCLIILGVIQNPFLEFPTNTTMSSTTTTINCPTCGLPIGSGASGIRVDGKAYHMHCISTLRCDNCDTVMGYATDGKLDGRFLKLFCAQCSKKF